MKEMDRKEMGYGLVSIGKGLLFILRVVESH